MTSVTVGIIAALASIISAVTTNSVTWVGAAPGMFTVRRIF